MTGIVRSSDASRFFALATGGIFLVLAWRLVMENVVDPSRCPVCGELNTCGVSQGKSECWCMALEIPQAALDRVPEAAKNVACICARCAAAQFVAKSG